MLSATKLCLTLCDPICTLALQASLSFTISRSLLKFMSIESVILSNHLILHHPLPFAFNFSQHQVVAVCFFSFPSELTFCIRWPKYCSFSINLPSEYLGLISFGIDWFDLLRIAYFLISLQSKGLSRVFSSTTQSYPTLCDPMNCTMPGLPVYHQHPEFTQTHVHQVGDDSQPSHPLSSPSLPAPSPSQNDFPFQ